MCRKYKVCRLITLGVAAVVVIALVMAVSQTHDGSVQLDKNKA